MLRLPPWILLAPALALAGPALADDGGGGRSIPEVIQAARDSAPAMDIAETDLEAAEHAVGSALSLNLPRLSVSDRQTYRFNNPEKYTYSYNVEQGGACLNDAESACLPVVVIDGVVTLPDSKWSNAVSVSGIQPLIAPRQIVAVKQAQGRVELARIKIKGAEEQLVMDLLSSWFQLQAAEGQREVYQRTLALDQELEANLVVRVDTGQSTQLDLERARLDVEEGKVRLRQLDESEALGAEELAFTAGAPLSEALRVCPAEPAEDPARALSLEGSTRLMAMEQQVEMDRLSLVAARTALIPTLNAVGGATWTGGGTSMEAVVESFMFDHWFVGGQLSVSLFEGMGRYHSNKTAQLGVESSRAKLEQERQEAALTDRQWSQQLAAISEDLALLDRSIILSEANVVAIKSRYLAGTATFEMWTFARQSLESLRLRRVASLSQQWQLVAARWISAGRVDELLSWVASVDADIAARSACRPITATPVEDRP